MRRSHTFSTALAIAAAGTVLSAHAVAAPVQATSTQFVHPVVSLAPQLVSVVPELTTEFAAPSFKAQQSYNWAGYVASAGGYTHVRGTWRVPTVSVTRGNRYSSTWVGIGGDPSPDLIQAGTEQDSVGGKAVYYAWTEILPLPESPISKFPVHAGDTITVDITQTSPGMWTITVTDATSHQVSTSSTPYASSNSTAEWIHEAPTVNGSIANLTRTSNAVFDFGTANGKVISAAGSVQTIAMLDSNNHQIATPGGLDSEGDGFQVADGRRTPPAPPS